MATAEMTKARVSAQEALLFIPYGVYIVTTGGESRQPGAFTASWLMQASFEPLLVAVAVDRASHSQTLLAENGLFAINILGKANIHLAARMATPHRINPHKFNGIAWHPGVTGAPLLDAAQAHLECQVRSRLETEGDHFIFIAEVVAGDVQRRETVLMLEASGLRYR
jgi:flavin reductase (DIM6/NTAB) family NADH-FMN oxidoreductase RutF